MTLKVMNCCNISNNEEEMNRMKKLQRKGKQEQAIEWVSTWPVGLSRVLCFFSRFHQTSDIASGLSTTVNYHTTSEWFEGVDVYGLLTHAHTLPRKLINLITAESEDLKMHFRDISAYIPFKWEKHWRGWKEFIWCEHHTSICRTCTSLCNSDVQCLSTYFCAIGYCSNPLFPVHSSSQMCPLLSFT